MIAQKKFRRGFTYMEVMIAVILLSIAAGAAMAGWNLAGKATATKRRTEMAVYIGVEELEIMKAKKYLNLDNTVRIQYYDKNGAQVGSAATNGYKAKAWSAALIDRDGSANTEDLRELYVEVWNNAETIKLDSIRTLLTFGGL